MPHKEILPVRLFRWEQREHQELMPSVRPTTPLRLGDRITGEGPASHSKRTDTSSKLQSGSCTLLLPPTQSSLSAASSLPGSTTRETARLLVIHLTVSRALRPAYSTIPLCVTEPWVSLSSASSICAYCLRIWRVSPFGHKV